MRFEKEIICVCKNKIKTRLQSRIYICVCKWVSEWKRRRDERNLKFSKMQMTSKSKEKKILKLKLM